MSTPLQWKGMRLHLLLTSQYLYPYKIYFDSETNHLKTLENHWKLVPLYFVTIGLCFIFGLTCTLAQLLKYIYLPNRISGVTIGFMVIMLAFGLVTLTTNLLVITSGSGMANYLNALSDFQKQYYQKIALIRRRSECYKTYNLLDHFKELNLEIVKLVRRQENVDTLGIIISNHAVYSTFVAWTLPIICYYFRLDPFSYVIEDLMPNPPESRSNILTLFLTGFNLLVNYVIVMEACRANTFIFMFVLVHQSLLLKCIKLISMSQVTTNLMRKYTQLQILVRSGLWFMEKIVGSTLIGTFFICLFLTCFTAFGWKIFNLNIYVAFFPSTPICYLAIGMAFNITVRIYEISQNLIHYQWPRQAMKMHESGNSNWASVKVFKRMLRVHQPIIVQVGKLVIMDQATKRSYFGSISIYTANVLILYNLSL